MAARIERIELGGVGVVRALLGVSPDPGPRQRLPWLKGSRAVGLLRGADRPPFARSRSPPPFHGPTQMPERWEHFLGTIIRKFEGQSGWGCPWVGESEYVKHLEAVLLLLCYIPSKTRKMTPKAVETQVDVILTKKTEEIVLSHSEPVKKGTDKARQPEPPLPDPEGRMLRQKKVVAEKKTWQRSLSVLGRSFCATMTQTGWGCDFI